ncbi:MAG: LysR substrate-binding domain-containing protein, partial [Betaproteobacteria bacterium]
IDVAIRYCPVAAAPPGSIRMFGEEIVAVCSPRLVRDRAHPLNAPGDLRHHTLLHFDHTQGSIPWIMWGVWLESAGLSELRPAGSLRFSHYDQLIAAAVQGQGVALGRRPLVENLLADGSLIAPFRSDSVTDRAYFIVRAANTRASRDVDEFVAWLVAESAELVRVMEKNRIRLRRSNAA